MPRRLKTAAYALTGLMTTVVLLAILTLRMVREPQPFYRDAIRDNPQELQSASQRMESRVSALYSDAKKPGRWRTVFTDDEVNGWLAVALKDKYDDILPPEVVDPRVAFTTDKFQVGYRYDGEQVDAMISIEGDAFMSGDDIAAVRFRRVRAGALPLPASSVVEYISDAAKKLEVAVKWTELEGDPVLLVPVENALSTDEERRQMDAVELHDGELLLMGSTEPRPKPAAAARAVAASSASR